MYGYKFEPGDRVASDSVDPFFGTVLEPNESAKDNPLNINLHLDDGYEATYYSRGYNLIVRGKDIPSGEPDLRKALIALWKPNLVFRQVKTVVQKGKKSISNKIKPRNHPSTKFDNWKQARAETPLEEHKYLLEESEMFFGFTTHKSLYDNENEEIRGKELYFSKRTCGSFHNEDREHWKEFPAVDLTGDSHKICPKKWQIVCGTPEEGPEGWYLNNWFIASNQFVKMWEMIVYPKRTIKVPLSSGVKGLLKVPELYCEDVKKEKHNTFIHTMYMGERLTGSVLGLNYAELVELCHNPNQREIINAECQRIIEHHEPTCDICKNEHDDDLYREHKSSLLLKRITRVYIRAMKLVYGMYTDAEASLF